MKVVCDNCRAVYKVPGEKLTKAVNKATCRNCGHRMLIPRPKPNADPEERTLVTAVPPTPVGAPPRSHVQEDREHTLPSRAPSHGRADDVRMDTPMAPSRIGDTVPAPEEGGYAPAPGGRGRGPSEQTTVKPQAPGGRSRGSTPPPSPQRRSIPSAPPPEPRRPESRTPAPEARRSAPPPPPPREEDVGGIDPSYEGPRGRGPSSLPPASQPPATRRTPSAPPARAPRATPAPAPARGGNGGGNGGAALAAYAAPAHDPAGDLNWALLGTTIALFGGFLLSILSIWNNALIMWFGLAMTFGGGILSFLVLLTGARGRRPAQTMLSVVLGLLIAMFLSTFLVGTKLGAERVIDAYDINFSNVGLTAGSATPAVAPQPVAAQPVPLDPGAPPAEPQPAGAEPIPVPVPVPGRPPAPPPRPQPGRPAPAPAPPPPPQPGRTQPAPVPAPPPAPAPVPGMLPTVPMEVIHTIVSNNIEVKRCFVPLFQAGTLPNRVDAQFTIAPSGRANGAVLVQPAYRGSSLESCLSRAISGLSFPPTAQGTSANYPFILQ